MIIVNRGKVNRRAIELVGVTSKKGADTIGMFGSGSGMAAVLALRLGLELSISSEDERGAFEMVPWADATERVWWRFYAGVRAVPKWYDDLVNVVRGTVSRPTSFSIAFGENDWTNAWQVVREFVSNAKDADPDYRVYRTDSDFENDLPSLKAMYGPDGMVVVRISGTGVDKTLDKWYRFFAFDPPSTLSVDGKRTEATCVSGLRKNHSPTGMSAPLYVKGVRVFHRIPGGSYFSYETSSVKITESRSLEAEVEFTVAASSMVDKFLRTASQDEVQRLIDFVKSDENSFEARLPLYLFKRTTPSATRAELPTSVVTPTQVAVSDSHRLTPQWRDYFVAESPLPPQPLAAASVQEILNVLLWNERVRKRGDINAYDKQSRYVAVTDDAFKTIADALSVKLNFDLKG